MTFKKEDCFMYQFFRLDDCLYCDEIAREHCKDYVPFIYSRQTKPDEIPSSASEQYTHHCGDEGLVLDKTADVSNHINLRNSNYIPMIIRKNEYVISKAQKVLEWIRRSNDGGVI
jgi:hypothetical protein